MFAPHRSPVFLYVQGEGEASAEDVSRGFQAEIGIPLGALFVQVCLLSIRLQRSAKPSLGVYS